MKVVRKSILTSVIRERELDISEQQLLLYLNGALLQEAFPHLSAGDREFFKTGITEEEWDNAFGEEEEEDYDGYEDN